MNNYGKYMTVAVKNAAIPDTFKLSSPSKISSKQKSSISFPAGPDFSCPGATDACEDCYAKKHRHLWAPVQKIMADNWKLLKKLEATNQTTKAVDLLLKEMRDDLKIFRINESGDVNSAWVINMWAQLVREKRDTLFWAYTRSFNLNFSPLTRLPNFTLWASTDEFNLKRAQEFVRRFRKSGTKHAYGPWKHDAPLPKNSFCCPVTAKKMASRGACERCMLCVVKKQTNKNVVFLKH